MRKDETNIHHSTPVELQDHPLFTGKHTIGMMTAEAPKFEVQDKGGNPSLEQHLRQMGLQFEKTHGNYGGPENSYIVHNPTREQMHHLSHKFGQEAYLFSQNGQHELGFAHGPNAGQHHKALSTISFSKTPPADNWTHIPGRGYLGLHFDFDKLHPSPLRTEPGTQEHNEVTALKSEVRLTVLRALKKALQ